MTRCITIIDTGDRCAHPATSGSFRCYYHAKLAAKLTGPCPPMSAEDIAEQRRREIEDEESQLDGDWESPTEYELGISELWDSRDPESVVPRRDVDCSQILW